MSGAPLKLTRTAMRAEFINPFLQAAIEVLAAETRLRVDRGGPTLQPSTTRTSHDVNALVEVSGERIAGQVLVGMTRDTALALVGSILDRPFVELDELATSGIAELTNVIAARACALLDAAGYPCTATPAALEAGAGLSMLAGQRLVVPLHLRLEASLSFKSR